MATESTEVVGAPGVESAYIELKSGAKAHYMVAGEEGAPPVILLHGGLPGSSGSAGWRFMLPALAAAGLRAYAPDRPGFGEADTREQHWPKRGYLSWVEFVDEFADALGLDTFGIAGNSEGAQTSIYYAINHPERVERMALIACSRINPWLGIDALIQHRTDAALRQKDAYATSTAWNAKAAEDPNLGQMLKLTGRLDALTIPATYLYGRQDVLSPVENAYFQEDLLPNIQFFYPDECGHQGQTDQPEMFNQVFAEFFTEGRVTAKTAEWAGISTRRPRLEGVVEPASA